MKRPRFRVYQAKDGFRWQLLAANNRLIAESGEAYTRKASAERAVKAVRLAVARSSAQTVGKVFVVSEQHGKRTANQIARFGGAGLRGL